MTNYVTTCKIHGKLTEEQTRLNRISPKGKKYLRCGLCRNEQARKRLAAKYIYSPKKHEKHKLPKNVSKDNRNHAYTLRHRFKLSYDDYQKILIKQNHVCAICLKHETQLKKQYKKIKMLSVDHCHTTGKIRGLLCAKCNIGLGNFLDSIELLESAIEYLKASK